MSTHARIADSSIFGLQHSRHQSLGSYTNQAIMIIHDYFNSALPLKRKYRNVQNSDCMTNDAKVRDNGNHKAT